jgi:hypothetical protein
MKIEIKVSDKLVAFVRGIFTTRNAVFATAAILFGFGVLLFGAQIQKKNSFKALDIIHSSLINENFDQLFTQVNEQDTAISNLRAGVGDFWCKIRAKAATYSDSMEPPNPGEKSHSFRLKAATF